MRLLVCGSREYDNEAKVKGIVEQLEATYLVFGDCRGVDTNAHDVAHDLDIPHDPPYIADWYPTGRLFRGAGAVRNKRMLKEGKPDVVAAVFDNTKCSGTNLMVGIARKANVPVVEFIMTGGSDG